MVGVGSWSELQLLRSLTSVVSFVSCIGAGLSVSDIPRLESCVALGPWLPSSGESKLLRKRTAVKKAS